MKLYKNTFLNPYILMILSVCMAVSCGLPSLDEDDDEDPIEAGSGGSQTDEVGDDTETVSHLEVINSNSLALAYPGGLSLSVFPQATSSTTLRLADETDPTKETISEKIEEENKILAGGGECLGDIFGHDRKEEQITCYEFDQEMMYGAFQGPLGTRTGTVSSTDNEACLVSFARSKVSGVQTMVERGLGLVQGMMCQAKKSGTAEDLPGVGETLDLRTEVATALGSRAQSVTIASIKRLADENGHPVYRTDVVLALSVLENGQNSSVTQEMHLVHSPQDETNTGYVGTLWTKVASPNAVGTGPSDNYLSIRYARSGEGAATPSLQAELIRAKIASDLGATAFESGVLNLNVGAQFEGSSSQQSYGSYYNPTTSQVYANSNDAISGMMYVAFHLNPEDNTGVTSYWQNPGGNYSENARGMIFSLAKNATTGALEGCGTSGATGSSQNNATSIRKAIYEKTPGKLIANGFYHPFFSTQASGGGTQTCSFDIGTDANGSFHTKICDATASPLFNTETRVNGMASNAKWWKPTIADATMAALADTWVTAQTGSIITQQCVKQDTTTGKYVIDTAKTKEAAGYSLHDTVVETAVSVKAPDLSGLKTLKVE
ncbi:MAG: hypothetical protein AB8C84_01365 [Oligoflexales bacterium]